MVFSWSDTYGNNESGMSLLFRHGRVARRFVHGQVFQLLKEESKDQVLYSKNFFKEGFFLRRYQTGSSVATRNESWVQTIKNNSGKLILGGTFVLGGISATIYVQLRQDVEVQVDEPEALEQLTNWSGTHEVETKRLLKPETVEVCDSAYEKILTLDFSMRTFLFCFVKGT